jgi:hypothetical protein
MSDTNIFFREIQAAHSPLKSSHFRQVAGKMIEPSEQQIRLKIYTVAFRDLWQQKTRMYFTIPQR